MAKKLKRRKKEDEVKPGKVKKDKAAKPEKEKKSKKSAAPSAADLIQGLESILVALKDSGDIEKFDGGSVNIPGTNIRNAMQKIKNMAQDIRVQILDIRKAAK